MTTTQEQTNGSSNGARRFEDKPAVRERVPLLIGLMGPSGGGKTFSALRLAGGIQRVSGGEIYLIDTEAKRALHYADRFKFRHVPFTPPFGSLDYLAAIDHCVKRGAATVIVDSMSHEHEGPGGMLEQHEKEIEELLKKWKNASRDTVQMTAWAKPKAARRRMINSILQMPANFIFCFRAKDKVKIATKAQRNAGEDAVASLGFMPIAGEEFVFEMTVNCLLMPGAGGVPTWQSQEMGEKKMIKLPEQFRQLLLGGERPLDEDMGEAMARWAAGAADAESPFAKFSAAIKGCATLDELRAVKAEVDEIPKKKTVPAAQFKVLKDAVAERAKEIQAATTGRDDYGDPVHDHETGEVREPGID